MNKIVMSLGLLVFFISLIIYSQQGLDIVEVLKRSFAVFFVVTFMFTILAILFIKAINQTSLKKAQKMKDKISGIDHE
jgi:FtsH-binding integral membrane protein